MDTITAKTVDGREFTFAVEFEHDDSAGAPWKNGDFHGEVSEWTSRKKQPGELVLSEDRGSKRYYDFQGTCKTALRDGWNTKPFIIEGETKRQRAERAVMADYEYLRQWCNDEWEYVGVIVTLLDADGEKTDVDNSLWCVETFNDYHLTVAQELADEIVSGFGSEWHEVTKTTYARSV